MSKLRLREFTTAISRDGSARACAGWSSERCNRTQKSALTHRHGGVDEPAVDRRGTPSLADRLLVISLAVGVIGFTVTPLTVSDFAATVASLTSVRSTGPVDDAPPVAMRFRPGDHLAPITVASDPLLAFSASPSRHLVDRDTHRGQGDARLYLRDAAAAAHRYAWPGLERGETRTDLWLNAPASIGSTSPFDPIVEK